MPRIIIPGGIPGFIIIDPGFIIIDPGGIPGGIIANGGLGMPIPMPICICMPGGILRIIIACCWL